MAARTACLGQEIKYGLQKIENPKDAGPVKVFNLAELEEFAAKRGLKVSPEAYAKVAE